MIRFQPMTKKRRLDIDKSEDKWSDMPDCVLVYILSFLNTKDAVQTCILSKRWKPIWKYIPTLTLHSSNFSTLKSFDKFVSKILSLRDKSIVLNAIDFDRNGSIESGLLKRVANYVLSHNVKLHRLGIDVKGDICHILPCISSCLTLTSLKLSVSPKGRYNYGRTLFPKSLNLPALTLLHLGNFTFCAGEDGRIKPFSAFNMLNCLIIDNCTVKDAKNLCISSETLVSLTMRNHSFEFYKIVLSAPSLCTFSFIGTPYQIFCSSSLSSVKQVNIDAEMMANYTLPPLVLLSWLWHLANVKSLTVSTSTLQVLSLIPDVLKDNLSRIRSLKSLKVKIKPLSFGLSMTLKSIKLEKALKVGFEPSSPIPDGIVDLLLQNSPSAVVEIVEYSRVDDSFDHLSKFSSSLFLQFLQPSSHEPIMDGLQRMQHLPAYFLSYGIKQVNIDAQEYRAPLTIGLVLLSWPQDLANVESLAVTSTTLQILSLVPDLLEIKLPSLCNLKPLEVELLPLDNDGFLLNLMKEAMLKKAAAKSRKEVAKLRKAFKAGSEPPAIPDGIVDFLRQNSPSAKVNITTDFSACFNLKQVVESIKGAEIIKFRSRFNLPGSSYATPAPTSATTPATAAPPN